jgi:hypothetical protein
MGGSDNKTLKHDFTLIRCLAFENRVKGFDQNNNQGAMTLYNCTGFSNGTNYSIDGGSSTLMIKNCISAGSGSNALKGGTQSANNFSVPLSDFESIDPASVLGPRDADGNLPAITFMHLTAGSDLIDAGDILDDVEFNGQAPDLGCFETGGIISIILQNPSDDSNRYRHLFFSTAQNTRLLNCILTISGRTAGRSLNKNPCTPGMYIHRVDGRSVLLGCSSR